MGHTDRSPLTENGDFAAEVAAAQGGDAVALGRILGGVRPYLLTVANQDLPEELRRKCGGSTWSRRPCWRPTVASPASTAAGPMSCGPGSRGSSAITSRTGNDGSARRNGGRSRRERSLHASPAAVSLATRLVDPDPTPSTFAADREEAAAIDAALKRLEPGKRTVVVLRNRSHLAWDKVGRRLDRSPDAARMLWKRAIQHLEQKLDLDGGAPIRAAETRRHRRRQPGLTHGP